MTKEEELAFDLALKALENSVDLVREDAYNAEKLYGNYPSRQGKVAGLKVLADDHEKAITAIKQARSAPVQEQRPYAYANPNDLCADTAFRWCEIGEFTMPVYTTPPAAREWVGLTDEEVNDCIKFPRRNLLARDGTTSQRIARAIETKLREKNNGVSKPRESP
jgi:hypothetical protein